MSLRRIGFLALSAAVVLISPLAIDLGGAALAGGGRGSVTSGYFFGMLHQRLGTALLDRGSAGLVISNIGSSGNDGVSVELSQPAPPGGVTPGWAGTVDFGPAGGLSAGAYVRVRAGALGLGPVAGFRVSETGGGHAAVSFEQVLCPTCDMTVQLLRDGAVVSSATYPGSFTDPLVTGDIGTTPVGSVPFLIGGRKVDDDVIDFTLIVLNEQPLSLPGLPPRDADAVVVRLNGLPPGTRYIGNLTVTGANTGPMTVQDEGLLKTSSKGTVKFFNEAKGFGRITGGGDLDGDGIPDIVVSNIGSSGQDGVTFKRFGIGDTAPEFPSGAVSAECDWGHAGALPTGSSMKFIIGDDAPVVQTYTLAVSETGGGQGAVSMIPCNEPGCCTPPCAGVVVEAIRNGVLVDRVVHNAGLPSVLAVGNIGSSGNDGVTFFAALIDSCLNIVEDRYLLGLRCPAPGPIALTGSSVGVVTADTVRVRITPADGAGALGSPQLLASSVSQFLVLNGEERREYINDMTFGGLPHDALGSAALGVTPDGSLQISNIGSSGNDGVSIALGEALGAALEIDFGQGGSLPTGFHVSAGEPTNSINDVNRMVIQGTGGGRAALSFEQTTCPTCPLQVELLLDGHVVRSAMYPPPYPGQLVTGNFGSSGASGVKVVTDRDSGRSSVHNPVPTALTLAGAGQTPVQADGMRMTLTGLPPGVAADGISAMQITASGIPDFRVRDQFVLNDYNIADSGPCPNLALGGATMCASHAHAVSGGQVAGYSLKVSDIGSSGNDGVRIDPPDEDCDGVADLAESIYVTLTPTPLPAAAKHAINTKGTGAQGGLAGASFFDVFMEIEDVGASDEITVDLSGVGSTSYRTELYLAGALVLSQPGMSGPLAASVPSSAALLGILSGVRPDNGILAVQLGCRWGSPVLIALPVGVAAIGDEMRVVAENPTFHASGVVWMSLTAANLTGGEFTLTEETSRLVNTCPADVVPVGAVDHVVNVSDLLAVIGTWGPCVGCPPTHCPADIAPIVGGMSVPDCQINVSDLLAVIGTWGACPCSALKG